MYKASVIIASYNKIGFLKLVFAGLERQVEKQFEVIIADDGSGDDFVEELKTISEKSGFDVQHVWHEDRGWRKNEILNKAVLKSKSDYLIFLDADCIPHRYFIHEHLVNKSENTILAGRRANLTLEKTNSLNYDKVRNGYLEKAQFKMIWDGLTRKTQHPEKSIYIRSGYIRKIIQSKSIKLLGCNFSMHKEDLLNLNGFDERYLAPTYGEDVDLELRAINAGMKVKSVNNMAIQYHLYHKILDRKNDNILIYNENKDQRVTSTPFGINKAN